MMKHLFCSVRHSVLLCLVVFFLCTYLLPLGVRPLVRPDEFRYAEIPREMLSSGDWTVHRLNGVRYFEKPVLGYQLTAMSFALFGENAFALRLPSALAVFLTAAFLYLLVSCKVRDPLLPGLATGIYLTFGLVFGVGTFAVMDSQLTCMLSLCIMAFYFAWSSPGIRTQCIWLIAAGVFAGLAFLIKGFLAMAIPVLVIVPFLIWQKNWRKLFLYPWLPLLAMLMIILPWSLTIHQAEPDFWRYFFWEEHINRFFSHTYDRKPQPFWYFLPVLLGGVMPAGLLWLAAWRGVVKEWLTEPFLRFLLCWTILPFLFFSASSCKLGTYILPCFPPLAILTAIAIRRAMRRNLQATEKIMNFLRYSWGGLWLIISGTGFIALILLPFIPGIPDPYPKFHLYPWFLVIYCLVYGLILFRLKCKIISMLQKIFLGLIPILLLGIFSIPSSFFGDKMTSIGLGNCLKQLPVSQDDIIITGRSEMAAVAWELKRSDLIIIGKWGELEYGFKNYPEYAARHYPEEDLPNLIKETRPYRLVYISMRNLKKKPLPAEWLKYEHAVSDGIVLIRF